MAVKYLKETEAGKALREQLKNKSFKSQLKAESRLRRKAKREGGTLITSTISQPTQITQPTLKKEVTPLTIYEAAAEKGLDKNSIQLQSTLPQKSYTDSIQKKLETTRVTIYEKPKETQTIKQYLESKQPMSYDISKQGLIKSEQGGFSDILAEQSVNKNIAEERASERRAEGVYVKPPKKEVTMFSPLRKAIDIKDKVVGYVKPKYEKAQEYISSKLKKYNVFGVTPQSESIKTTTINGKKVDVLYRTPTWIDKARQQNELDREKAEKKYRYYNATNSTIGKTASKLAVYGTNINEAAFGAEYATRQYFTEKPLEAGVLVGAGFGVGAAGVAAASIGTKIATVIDVAGKVAGLAYYGTKAAEIVSKSSYFEKGKVFGKAVTESVLFLGGATKGAKLAIKAGYKPKPSEFPSLKTSKISVVEGTKGNEVERTIYRGLRITQPSTGKSLDLVGYTTKEGLSFGTPTKNVVSALQPRLNIQYVPERMSISNKGKYTYKPAKSIIKREGLEYKFSMESLANPTLKKVALKTESWAELERLRSVYGEAGKKAFKEILKLVSNKRLYKAPSKVYRPLEKVESFETEKGFSYSVGKLGKQKTFIRKTASELYGFGASAKTQIKGETRASGDIDVSTLKSSKYTSRFAKSQAKELTQMGDQASWSKDEPFLVSTKVGGKEHKLDIHPMDQPDYAQAPESFYGTPYSQKTFKVKTVSGSKARVKSLAFTFLGKASSAATLRVREGKFYIAPEEHRTKDIGDLAVTAKELLKKVGQSPKLTRALEKQYSPEIISGKKIPEAKSTFPSPSKPIIPKAIVSFAPIVSKLQKSSFKDLTSKSSVSKQITSKSFYVPSRVSKSQYKSPSKNISIFSKSFSPSKSISPSRSPSISPSRSFSPSKSISPSRSPSISPSRSFSPSKSISPSRSPSISPSRSISPRPPPPPLLRIRTNKPIYRKIKIKKIKRTKEYTPTLYSLAYRVKGKKPKYGTLSGLGIRPI